MLSGVSRVLPLLSLVVKDCESFVIILWICLQEAAGIDAVGAWEINSFYLRVICSTYIEHTFCPLSVYLQTISL